MHTIANYIRAITAKRRKKPDLILTIGIPGAGKSTWIRQQKNYKVISPDAIRAELGDISDQSLSRIAWPRAKDMTKRALASGENVILDATNVDASNRKSFLKGLPPHNLKAKIFRVDPEEAKKRIRRDIKKKIPRAKVPPNIVDEMHEKFMKSLSTLKSEGFEVI